MHRSKETVQKSPSKVVSPKQSLKNIINCENLPKTIVKKKLITFDSDGESQDGTSASIHQKLPAVTRQNAKRKRRY